jgi:HD-GYP domain-containing protein (c-di-GMP phosphodiesterase class II)
MGNKSDSQRADTARAPRAYPFYIHLAVLFSLLILATGGLIAWLSYAQGRDITLSATRDAFTHIGRETHSRLRESVEPASRFTDLLALQRVTSARTTATRVETLSYLRHAFEKSTVTAVYVGYADGGFFLLRPLNEDWLHKTFAAPPDARYLVQSIERGGDIAEYIYFDAHLRELSRRPAPEYELDPRTRPWYRLARGGQEKVFTEPYVFYSTGRPGMTLAKPASDYAVVGVDLTLGHLSAQLAKLRTLPGMRIVLFDERRRLLASSDDAQALARRQGEGMVLNTLDDGDDALLAALPMPGPDTAMDADLEAMGRQWKSSVLPIETARGPLYLAIAVPFDELLKDLRELRIRNMLLSLGLLLFAVPLTTLVAHGVARALRQITEQAQDIRAFNFGGPALGRSIILEVDQLAQAMQMMRTTISNFLEVAASLGAERDLNHLLRRVVQETCEDIGADGGLVYLPDATERQLRPTALVDRTGKALEFEALNLAVESESPVATAFVDCGSAVIDLSGSELSELSAFQALWPKAKTVTAIPLLERGGDRVGVLVVFMREQPSRARLAFAEALSGIAAVTIEAQRALELRRELHESFIRLIASAIDAKSPYTGGHCQRVPELTFMLARAACEANTGLYKDFNLNDQEWEALHIAGWLHDCGKVTTPEYVVDKATKLETIYDRLHEIRMRFEVLKRDAEIDCLTKTAAGGDAAAPRAECERVQAELDEEFAFVAGCNQGGEFMHAESIAKLERIAQRTWRRTLDDRIGLSRDESDRKAKLPQQVLPATEQLLADRTDHLIPRPAGEELQSDNPWGFKIPAPEYKFNLGELHNLRTARGTLSDEERYIINHHIVQTIVMLSQLPFPKHLRCVPEIAGGHHEKMDGTGYPKRLKREEMSLAARMMAIADIFEALTASDRPYKKAKTLSESLKILQKMKQEGHVDPDLYELFIDAGVWRVYAERFLKPEQIDLAEASAYR